MPAELGQQILVWAAKPGGLTGNWPEGVLYLVLGLIGAAVTLYLFTGEFLPSMGGKEQIDLYERELSALKERQERIRNWQEDCVKPDGRCPSGRVDELKGIEVAYAAEARELEANIGRRRSTLLLIAFPLYFLLGGAFAALFATNALQALLVGFGWTAIADRLGLRKEQTARKTARNREIDDLTQAGLAKGKEAAALATRVETLEKANAAKQNAITEALELIEALRSTGGSHS